MRILNFKNCPLFGKHGKVYTGLVVLPASILLMVLIAAVFFSYKAERAQIGASHEQRLQDLTSHLLATVQESGAAKPDSGDLETYVRSTPQNEFFNLHLFITEGGKIIASTDRSMIGKIASDVLTGTNNKVSVKVQIPVGGSSQLVAHEDISREVSKLQRKSLWLATLAIFVTASVGVILHKIFRIRITKSVRLLQQYISEISPDTELSQDLSQEFVSLWNSWKHSLERIEPTIHSLIEAERKASFIVLCNSIRQSLSRILEEMEPISILPSRALAASDIRALKEAQRMLKKLNETLENAELAPDPFHLSNRILQAGNVPEQDKEQSETRRSI